MQLTSNAIHVWSGTLSVNPSQEAAYFAILSSAEQSRVQQFKFPEDKRRFSVARAMLRKILSLYINVLPTEIEIHTDRHGKPYLDGSRGQAAGRRRHLDPGRQQHLDPGRQQHLDPGRQQLLDPGRQQHLDLGRRRHLDPGKQQHLDLEGQHPLEFNLSHSGEMAVYAISYSPLGIDIEQIKTQSHAGVIEKYFSEQEKKAIQQLPTDQQNTEFYRIWTRKEALVKAIGKGLFMSLSKLDYAAKSWSICSLSIHPDYQAALAYTPPTKDLSQFVFQHV